MLGLLESVDDGIDNVVEYNHRRADTHTSVGSGGGGGGVDDILRRLGNVETGVSELRSEVSAISAILSHLATAASVSEVNSKVAGIEAIIPHLATKADVISLETAIIKWIIATTLTSAALAFAIAKFVH
jgi:hypothetical protein